MATSGSAIVFAGTTVIIALLSLGVAGIPLVTSLGYAAAVAVVAAVAGAITLLPALLALVGGGIHRLHVPAFLRPKPKEPGRGVWGRWGRLVTRRPWLAMAVALPLLGLLIIPLFSLNLGQEDVGATPTSTTERQAYDLTTEGFGVGYNGPFLVAVDLDTPAQPSATVASQEKQLNDLQAELEQEQAEGQQQQAQLEAEGAQLQAQQAELVAQQAALTAQQAELEREAAALARQRAALEAQVAVLRRELEAITGRRGGLLARAEAAVARARAAAVRRQTLERQLAAVAARRAQVEAQIAAAEADARPPLEALLAKLQAEEQRLRGAVAAEVSSARTQLAQAAALRRQAAALQRQAVARPRPPETLRREIAALVADARALAAQAASLDAQKRQLEAEAAALQRQAAGLQAQAASLQAQEASLTQLQATAAAQQQQALALKNELTKELTKAGGDDRGTDPRLVKIQDALTATSGIVLTSPPQINEKGDAAIFTAIPSTAPAATQTATLVNTLRDTVLPEATAGSDLSTDVGGTTASNVDLASEISARLFLVIAVVIALSFVVLLVAFRSLMVPLQGAVVNLLCVGASFGVLTAVFQWGWGIGPLGIDTARDTVPIASFVPLMMFAVLFGLSMDYQVFLLSQVASHRAEGEDDRTALASGIASSARVITAAALIMIGVFGSFVLNGDPTVKQFGVGLAVAVALAASMVIVLTPALMALTGRATWHLPRLLERVIPHVDIEGETLLAEHARRRAAAEAAATTRG